MVSEFLRKYFIIILIFLKVTKKNLKNPKDRNPNRKKAWIWTGITAACLHTVKTMKTKIILYSKMHQIVSKNQFGSLWPVQWWCKVWKSGGASSSNVARRHYLAASSILSKWGRGPTALCPPVPPSLWSAMISMWLQVYFCSLFQKAYLLRKRSIFFRQIIVVYLGEFIWLTINLSEWAILRKLFGLRNYFNKKDMK